MHEFTNTFITAPKYCTKRVVLSLQSFYSLFFDALFGILVERFINAIIDGVDRG